MGAPISNEADSAGRLVMLMSAGFFPGLDGFAHGRGKDERERENRLLCRTNQRSLDSCVSVALLPWCVLLLGLVGSVSSHFDGAIGGWVSSRDTYIFTSFLLRNMDGEKGHLIVYLSPLVVSSINNFVSEVLLVLTIQRKSSLRTKVPCLFLPMKLLSVSPRTLSVSSTVSLGLIQDIDLPTPKDC